MKITYKHTIAIIYTIVLFLDRLDLTIVNVALPTVAEYFHVSIVATEWISLAFLLALAMSIPISGWLGERFGFKKIYIISMFLFGLGSTLCIFATSFNQLVLLRFIQGIGGGMLIPVGMTMIYRAYDPSEYASITSFTFLPSLIAPAIAPFLGGLLLDAFNWRLVFVLSGPISLLLAASALILLKEEQHESQYPLDLMGFILSAVILIDIFYSLSQFSKSGLTFASGMLLFALATLIWLFIKIETRQAHPLINLNFFKNRFFISINLIQLCFQICHFGAIFLIGLFLQVGAGFSATLAGLMMGMQAIGAMMVSRFSVKLFNQYDKRLAIIVGLCGVAILTPLLLLINKPAMLILGLLFFLVRGIFSGLCGTPIQTLSVIAFKKEELPTVNGIFNVCRQISISMGVALSSIMISVGLHFAGLTHGLNLPANKAFGVFSYGIFLIPIVALIGILITFSLNTNTITRET